MMKSAVSRPLAGQDPFRVGWISTLLEFRQDVNLPLAPRCGWAFLPRQSPSCTMSTAGTSWLVDRRIGTTAGHDAASTGVPAVQMLSATTTDSKSVTIEYQVNQTPDAANPTQFSVYRSSNGQFNSSDSLVDTVTLATPGMASVQGAINVDQSGQPATALGTHAAHDPLTRRLAALPREALCAGCCRPWLTVRDQQSSANRLVSRLHHRHRDPWRNPGSKLETWASLADRNRVHDETRGV